MIEFIAVSILIALAGALAIAARTTPKGSELLPARIRSREERRR